MSDSERSLAKVRPVAGVRSRGGGNRGGSWRSPLRACCTCMWPSFHGTPKVLSISGTGGGDFGCVAMLHAAHASSWCPWSCFGGQLWGLFGISVGSCSGLQTVSVVCLQGCPVLVAEEARGFSSCRRPQVCKGGLDSAELHRCSVACSECAARTGLLEWSRPLRAASLIVKLLHLCVS